jgi:hypothetical protein
MVTWTCGFSPFFRIAGLAKWLDIGDEGVTALRNGDNMIDGQRPFLSANRASPIETCANLLPFFLREGPEACAFFGIAKVLLHSLVIAPSFDVASPPCHHAAKM